jgi:BirA family biotin operon repressor/biotin-[acetyl-CoA-carboxylase] ligase
MQRVHFDSLDSTSDEALRRVARGERGPLLITASVQSAGRGRGGRTWTSPRGGVWMSLLWPGVAPMSRYEPAPLLAGLAVVRALESAAPSTTDHLAIKWPNDVLLNGRKVAGVLCQCEGDCLIVGVGINTNFSAAELPAAARVPAAVVHADVPRCIDAWLAAFTLDLHTLEGEGFTQAGAIRQRLAYRGEAVQWQDVDGQRQGVLRDLDAQGRLVLEIDGRLVVVASGEVRHLSRPGPRGL